MNSVILTLCFAASLYAAPPPADWLFERYVAGDVDTIRALLDQLPPDAAGEFFRGVFEPDGEKARYHYDRVVAFFPGTEAEGWALDKLWQFHWAKGDAAQARKYYGFLESRHPDWKLPDPAPEFDVKSDLTPDRIAREPVVEESSKPSAVSSQPEMGKWTVQVGAFSKHSGAEDTARKMARYGGVDLVERKSGGKTLIAVTVGSFASKRDAETLADEIRREAGVNGRVVEKE